MRCSVVCSSPASQTGRWLPPCAGAPLFNYLLSMCLCLSHAQLTQAARSVAYGQSEVYHSGPLIQSVRQLSQRAKRGGIECICETVCVCECECGCVLQIRWWPLSATSVRAASPCAQPITSKCWSAVFVSSVFVCFTIFVLQASDGIWYPTAPSVGFSPKDTYLSLLALTLCHPSPRCLCAAWPFWLMSPPFARSALFATRSGRSLAASKHAAFTGLRCVILCVGV